MTIDAWRRDKALTRWWASVLKTEEGQAFSEMISDSHIRHIPGRGLEPGQELGQIQGYDMCANNFAKAAVFIEDPAQIGPPSYEQDDTDSAPAPRKRK